MLWVQMRTGTKVHSRIVAKNGGSRRYWDTLLGQETRSSVSKPIRSR
jgi:hypothetical protein